MMVVFQGGRKQARHSSAALAAMIRRCVESPERYLSRKKNPV